MEKPYERPFEKRQPLASEKQKQGFRSGVGPCLDELGFLLVISLVSLVGTDLSLAELRKQRVLSQANAKMGMMVALGELQKHLGPDTRVSGTADLLDERRLNKPPNFFKTSTTRASLRAKVSISTKTEP